MSGRIVDHGDNCVGMSEDPRHPTDATARVLGTNTNVSDGRKEASEDVDKNSSYLSNMSRRVNSSRWIRSVLALGGSTLYLMEMVAQALQTPIAEPLGFIRRFLRSVLDQQTRGIAENVLHVDAKSSQILLEPSKLKDTEVNRRTTHSETTKQVQSFSTETTHSETSKQLKNLSTETTKVETPFVLESKAPMEVDNREDKLDDSLEECSVEDLILEGHESLDSLGFYEEETDVSGVDIMEIVLHDLTKTIEDEIDETDSKQVEVLAKILKTEGYLPELAVGDTFPSEDTGIIREEILRKTTVTSQENFKSIPVEQIVPQKRMEPIFEEESANHSLTEDYVENQDLEVDKSAEYEDFEKEVNISDVLVEEVVPQMDYDLDSTDDSNQEDVWDISNREEFKLTMNEVKWNKSRIKLDVFSKNDRLSGSCLEANKYTGIFAEASRDQDYLVLDEGDIMAPPAPASASIGRLPGFQHLYMYEPYKKRYDANCAQLNKECDEYEVGYTVDRVTTTYSELSKKFNKSHAEIYEQLNTSFTDPYKKLDDSVGQIDTLDDSVGQIDTLDDLVGQIDSLLDDLIGEALQQFSPGGKTLVAEKYEKRLHPVELIDSLLDDLIGGVVEISPSGAKNYVGVNEDFVDFLLSDDSFDSSFEMNEF